MGIKSAGAYVLHTDKIVLQWKFGGLALVLDKLRKMGEVIDEYEHEAAGER